MRNASLDVENLFDLIEKYHNDTLTDDEKKTIKLIQQFAANFALSKAYMQVNVADFPNSLAISLGNDTRDNISASFSRSADTYLSTLINSLIPDPEDEEETISPKTKKIATSSNALGL